jgi:sigma54-dependent transcription regulator
VDVRVIAATNQPLEERVTTTTFRKDLFYRLKVVRLDLPPLKDRREDIPVLLRHVIAKLNTREGVSVGPPDEELLGCLMAHDWPGNVRELNNLIEAIFIDPPEGPIALDHLPAAFHDMFIRYRTAVTNERERLICVLEQTKWNKAEAARHLNWSRMTLYRKLAQYQLDRLMYPSTGAAGYALHRKGERHGPDNHRRQTHASDCGWSATVRKAVGCLRFGHHIVPHAVSFTTPPGSQPIQGERSRREARDVRSRRPATRDAGVQPWTQWRVPTRSRRWPSRGLR